MTNHSIQSLRRLTGLFVAAIAVVAMSWVGGAQAYDSQCAPFAWFGGATNGTTYHCQPNVTFTVSTGTSSVSAIIDSSSTGSTAAAAIAVDAGAALTFSWTVSSPGAFAGAYYTTTQTISPAIGTVGASGSKVVTATSTANYVMTVNSAVSSTWAALGMTGTPPPENLTIAVTIRPPTISSFSATPSNLQQPSTTTSTLSWNVAGANADGISIDQGVGTVSTSGSKSVAPSDTTTYTLTATGVGGTSTQQVTVAYQPSASLTVTPATIQSGGSSTLAWTSTHATSIKIVDDQNNLVYSLTTCTSQCRQSPAGAPTVAAGSIAVSPTRLTTYTLTATGAAGTTPATATAKVTQSHVSVAWDQATNPTWLGTVAADPTTSSGAKYTPSAQAAAVTQSTRYPKAVHAKVTYSLASGTVVKDVFADITLGGGSSCTTNCGGGGTPGAVTGDVYSGGSVNNLVLDPKSVVSASGQIAGVTGPGGVPVPFQIPGYTTSNSLQWADSAVNGKTVLGARTQILAQATKLRKERVNVDHVLSTQDFTISNGFNLNPVASGSLAYTNTQSVNAATPEGQVWWVPRDLTINAATFYGRGTIIVGGKVTIKGNTSYSTDTKTAGSLGIILTGNGDVTVDPTVTNIVGAYFVPNGTISLATVLSGCSVAQATDTFENYPDGTTNFGWGTFLPSPAKAYVASGTGILNNQPTKGVAFYGGFGTADGTGVGASNPFTSAAAVARPLSASLPIATPQTVSFDVVALAGDNLTTVQSHPGYATGTDAGLNMALTGGAGQPILAVMTDTWRYWNGQTYLPIASSNSPAVSIGSWYHVQIDWSQAGWNFSVNGNRLNTQTLPFLSAYTSPMKYFMFYSDTNWYYFDNVSYPDCSTTSVQPLTAVGLFVGNTISFAGRLKPTISYDSRVTTATPPGFGVVSIPGIKETAP